MENKPSSVTVSLGYGVIIALAIIVFSLILFLLNLSHGTGLENLSYLILIAGIVLAQFNFRNKYQNGFITYGEAFKIGMLSSLFLSVIMGVYTFIFFKYIDPGAMEEIMIKTEQEMMDQGRSEMEIEQGMKFMSMVNNVGWYTFFALVGNFFIGTIISLITAIFVKKEDTGFGQPTV
jgi:hypothetical protein